VKIHEHPKRPTPIWGHHYKITLRAMWPPVVATPNHKTKNVPAMQKPVLGHPSGEVNHGALVVVVVYLVGLALPLSVFFCDYCRAYARCCIVLYSTAFIHAFYKKQ